MSPEFDFITENKAEHFNAGLGAGIFCDNSSSVTIDKSQITDNIANSDGGGVACWSASLNITNSIICNNTGRLAGGLDFSSASSVNITNCTISGNTCTYSDYGAEIAFLWCPSVMINNCILWGNCPNEIKSYESILMVTYSDVGGGHSGTGNINSDPLFVGGRNYHLTASSPCIDTGTSSGAPNTDIDGNPRPLGSGYDMGAYEFIPPCPNCSGDEVTITGKTFPPGGTCECIGTISITIGTGVNIPSGANVTFKAPKINVEPGFHAENGSIVKMQQ